jgi:hypothetical protein
MSDTAFRAPQLTMNLSGVTDEPEQLINCIFRQSPLFKYVLPALHGFSTIKAGSHEKNLSEVH